MSGTELKVKFLLSKGLDPNATSAVWGTPLLCAIRFGFEEVIQILLDAGEDPTMRASCQKFEDQSPIELAKRGIKLRSYRGMKAEYQRVLKLLKNAQFGHATATAALPAKSTTQNATKPPTKKRHATKKRAATALPEKPSTQNVTEPPTKKRKTNKLHPTAKNTSTRDVSTDNISCRRRSRTKLVS